MLRFSQFFFLNSHKIIYYPVLLFSSPGELILFFVCVCLCLLVVVPFSSVADGVIEEENVDQFGGQYCEPEYMEQYRELEPENEYREQELNFMNGKFNHIL